MRPQLSLLIDIDIECSIAICIWINSLISPSQLHVVFLVHRLHRDQMFVLQSKTSAGAWGGVIFYLPVHYIHTHRCQHVVRIAFTFTWDLTRVYIIHSITSSKPSYIDRMDACLFIVWWSLTEMINCLSKGRIQLNYPFIIICFL